MIYEIKLRKNQPRWLKEIIQLWLKKKKRFFQNVVIGQFFFG